MRGAVLPFRLLLLSLSGGLVLLNALALKQLGGKLSKFNSPFLSSLDLFRAEVQFCGEKFLSPTRECCSNCDSIRTAGA